MSWITASSRLGGLLRLHRKISSGQSGIPVVKKRDPALPVWNFLYIFAECNLCRVFGVFSISLMQRAEKSNFKQKNIDRVHQKKIKSSKKEYVTWKRFKLWTMKNFFCENYKPRVWLWLLYKITENNCRSRLFNKFIQSQKRYPTFSQKKVS